MIAPYNTSQVCHDTQVTIWVRISRLEMMSLNVHNLTHAFDSQRDLELSNDPIEQFSGAVAEQLSDPISSFDDAGAFGFGPEQDFGYDPSRGCSDHDVDKSAEVNVHDIVLDHDASQSRLEQLLVPQQPKFMWESPGFLSTVFGSGNIADEIFPVFSTSRPPRALVDLTGDDVEEPPIKRALRQGKHNPYFVRATKRPQ